MKALYIGMSSLALISLVGCSAIGLGEKSIDYRAAATQAPSLEVPPELTTPKTSDRYKVPDAKGESVATYSAYTRGVSAISPRVVVASSVLPVIKKVSIERDGSKRWLKVADKAENVWPIVHSFVQAAGFKIKSEDQAAGLIVTDWTENRAKIPKGGLRSIIGKVFDGLYSSGIKDQYRFRLARAQDGVSTEIHITQYGKELIVNSETDATDWRPRANDPELEAEMRQRLMVRFGRSPAQAAMTSGAAAVSTPGAFNLIDVFDGSKVIVINEAFDKSWRRVGLAIEQAGLVVEDKNREQGVYFLRRVKPEKSWLDTLEFWKSEEDTSQHYRVKVKDGGALCEVSVTDQNGTSNDVSKQKLNAIYKNIK
ncbi:MAG: outer membrane protein assembly factor BamC [Gallionella sp.]